MNVAQDTRTALMIVDSDPVAHIGIACMLSGCPWLSVSVCVRTWNEALAVARITYPDLAVAGMRPPNGAIRQLRDSVPAIKLVLFVPMAKLSDPPIADVDAVIPRDMGASGLTDSLSRVICGEQVLGIAAERGFACRDGRDLHGLTRREHQILRRVAIGETNAEIAQVLGLATNTVKTYFQRALEKLGARNRVEAVTYAREIGLL
jgi:two-component system, NarL family, nitrate/nitrite response regulator NarL